MAVSPFRKDSLFNLKIMQALLLCILCTFYAQASDVIRFNFGQNKDGNNWQITNDGVMGGLSIGKTRFKENSIVGVIWIILIIPLNLKKLGGYSESSAR